MLASLSPVPVHPILRLPVARHLKPERAIDIVAVADTHHALSTTLKIYVRSSPGNSEHIGSASSSATGSADQQAEGTLRERKPEYELKRSLGDLKQLRAKIEACVGKGDHCAVCKKVAEYMTYCWTRPPLFSRAWNGAMRLRLDVLTGFLHQLMRFASQLDIAAPDAAGCHEQFGVIVDSFFQPLFEKDPSSESTDRNQHGTD